MSERPEKGENMPVWWIREKSGLAHYWRLLLLKYVTCVRDASSLGWESVCRVELLRGIFMISQESGEKTDITKIETLTADEGKIATQIIIPRIFMIFMNVKLKK